MNMNIEWNRQWPSEDGMFWLHGWMYSDQQLQKPSTYLVKAQSQNGFVVCSTGGVILRDTDGCRGVWTKANVPTPPHGIRL